MRPLLSILLHGAAPALPPPSPSPLRKPATTQLSTYLSFDGDCREAFEFYARTLGGEVVAMMTFADNPGCEEIGPEERNKVMHACYRLDGFELMGTDATALYPYRGVTGAHVALGLSDVAEAERIFAALADGGTVQMPLQQTFWAQRYGIVADRFGVPWMINCAEAPCVA